MEVCRVPQFLGEPGKSSLLYESDLVHTKPTTDILLHGHAYAPLHKPITQVDVTLKVGKMTKALRVIGDRFWESGILDMTLTAPRPFEKMPIIYERAFGGADQKSDHPEKQGWERRNPLGRGFVMEAKHLEGQRAPNIEDPNDLISSWKHRPWPAGFGPIARDWSPRVELAGTYDERWEKERFPLLPEDFKDHYYLCAPKDQQAPAYLRGGEPVELHNLTRQGLLRFNLPRIALGFETRFLSGETVPHRGVLHTVILEPDGPRVLMVWHTTLPCHAKVLKLEKTTIRQKAFL
jgi:hypothetical protein